MKMPLTDSENAFVEKFIETKDAVVAIQHAYPKAEGRSIRTMAGAMMKNRKITDTIAARIGVVNTFTIDYLLLSCREIIEDKEANSKARVDAIALAAELAGHIERSTRKMKRVIKEKASPELNELVAKAGEYAKEKIN